ncbi:diacylglycerol kinase family enzyme [Allocatelliglobosispora scoriae]|uniref:Diacylglycerol kinase family enzyme n=1 Tax=Allocatelliglobosispora scoriae TaxID=643052 RepID=A0A841BN73_9ACTN|nr:diacylglycerol kinase family protein [Allocatelliglobosispora scoriae]MBB5868639.1 diacylglycerol kinase family enzyme [Allocatelliglobosispora scoriae]
MDPSAQKPSLISRIYALAALTALVLAVATLAYLLVNQILVLIGAIAALLVAVFAAWTALINRGVRRAVSLGVAVLALAGSVLLLGAKGFVGVGIVVSLTVASALAARAAIGRHRPLGLGEALPPGMVAVGRADRPVLLLNPLSGGGTVEHTDLQAQARKRGIRTVVLGERDNLRGIAEREITAGASAIGVAGGDGSQALVADVARRHNVAFVCVPAGTFNHFALDLGLDRQDPVAALDAFGPAVERRIDLGIVNDRVFVNNASMGAYATIVQSEDYRAMKFATTAGMLPDLIGADTTGFDLHFVGPQDEAFSAADVVLVANNPYAVVTPVGLGTRPSLDTGELGLFALRARAQDPPVVRHAVLTWSAAEFRVDSSATVAVGLDGEAIQLEPPLVFRTLHRALRVRQARHSVAPVALGHAPGVRQTAVALLRLVVGRPAWSSAARAAGVTPPRPS